MEDVIQSYRDTLALLISNVDGIVHCEATPSIAAVTELLQHFATFAIENKTKDLTLLKYEDIISSIAGLCKVCKCNKYVLTKMLRQVRFDAQFNPVWRIPEFEVDVTDINTFASIVINVLVMDGGSI